MACQIGGGGHALAALCLQLQNPQQLTVAAGNSNAFLVGFHDCAGSGGGDLYGVSSPTAVR